MHFDFRNINSQTNNNLDANIVGNFDRKKYSTNVNLDVKYGVNLKDKKSKEHLAVALKATHKNQRADHVVNYTLTVNLPAKVRDCRIVT